MDKYTYKQLKSMFHGVDFKFDHYYKFQFWYTEVDKDRSKLKGKSIRLVYGGKSCDIYRHHVSVNETYTFSDIVPDQVYINGELVYDEDGDLS